jgi:ABC-type branched-subunit amino acid transport system permease subunit
MTEIWKRLLTWMGIGAVLAVVVVGLFWGWEALKLLAVYFAILTLVTAVVWFFFLRLTLGVRRTFRKR